MRPFHNTPSLRTPEPPRKTALTGMALLLKLEDDFAHYREDSNKGYFKADPADIARFEAEIAAARKSINPD